MANRERSKRKKDVKPVNYTIQIYETTKERLHKVKDNLKVSLYEALDIVVAGYEENEKRKEKTAKLEKAS